MAKKKYVLHPGEIVSKYDQQVHKIGYRQLIDLYRLDPMECINFDRLDMAAKRDLGGLVHLFPSYHGDYALPKEPDPNA